MSQKRILLSQLGCIVTPYRMHQSKNLEWGTGIWNKIYHKYSPYVGFELPYRGSPAYITYAREYDMLRRFLPDYIIEKAPFIKEKRILGNPGVTGVTVFTPAQSQVISEFERTREYSNTWYVNLQTSVGKTLLSVYLSLYLGLKTLVCCYSKDVLKHWIDEYSQKSDIDPSRILLLTSRTIDKLLVGKLDPNDYDIYIGTTTLLRSFADTRGDYGRLTDFANICGFGTFIYDEAHRHVSTMVKLLSVINTRYQVFLSAEITLGNDDKARMFKEVFRHTHVVTLTDELRKSMKYTKITSIFFDSKPDSIEQPSIFEHGMYNPNLYSDYEFRKGILQQAVVYLLRKVVYENPKKYRALVLCTRVPPVEYLTRVLQKEFPTLKVGRYHGAVPDEEKAYVKDNADIIVATYASFGTGLDTTGIKYVLSTNQCNRVEDNQAAGRSRPLKDGTHARYYMFIDQGFPYCMRKLKKRLEYILDTKAINERSDSWRYDVNEHPEEVMKYEPVSLDNSDICWNQGDRSVILDATDNDRYDDEEVSDQ